MKEFNAQAALRQLQHFQKKEARPLGFVMEKILEFQVVLA
jgi:hypothetical protein